MESRKCTIHSLTLEEFIPGDKHSFKYPTKELSQEDKAAAQKAQEFVSQITENNDSNNEDNEDNDDEEKIDNALLEETTQRPTAFKLRMTVSGGTYVRSIVHDLGKALGSSAHVVELTRTRQGEFALPQSSTEDGGMSTGKNVIDWNVFEKALTEKSDEYNEGELQEWEQQLISVIKTDI